MKKLTSVSENLNGTDGAKVTDIFGGFRLDTIEMCLRKHLAFAFFRLRAGTDR